ncbi:hypothetical protein F0562_019199 [Nyssa sinensis]|uniref:Uncharacterized protein n=1 Tax=Nyssa sinensis TaxID=561372 RepID=A0A5J4ZC69_9ASTE|nr:hypothetical protein F0562_019199 [Nyssa sinensis]
MWNLQSYWLHFLAAPIAEFKSSVFSTRSMDEEMISPSGSMFESNLLLPLAVKRGTCIITNMGAIFFWEVDPLGAQKKILQDSKQPGLQHLIQEREITLEKGLTSAKQNKTMYSNNQKTGLKEVATKTHPLHE